MPSLLDEVSGQIRDCDSHEFIPAHMWPDVFGEMSRPFAEFFMKHHDPEAPVSLSSPVERDDLPISPETVADCWGRGAWAPGAIDMTRRDQLMTAIGVEEAFIFSSAFGMIPLMMPTADLVDLERLFGVPLTEEELGFLPTREILNMMAAIYGTAWNDWCIEIAKISPRLRPVAGLDSSDMEAAIKEADRVISNGVRAVSVSSGLPIGGKSPGHVDCDPFWEFLVDRNIPLVLHGGTDFGLFRDIAAWRDYGVAGARMGEKNPSAEIVLDPYSISIINAGVENFVTLMIYGGTFERFPELRVGCVECSAFWVGPLAENMENVGRQLRRLTSHLSLTPGEYLQRNVRVAPMCWEPVDKYIDRHGLEDVYVFGSDYPHFEGGKDPIGNFAAKLDRLGPAVAKKFFVDNAKLLMP
jgi:predicted TIM-barrel fold metal-dependent hydrolase